VYEYFGALQMFVIAAAISLLAFFIAWYSIPADKTT